MKQPTHAVKYTFAVLLLAALTTTQMLSAVYAKYTFISDPFMDSARVAKYEVVLIDHDENANMGNTANSGLNGNDVNLDAAGSVNISGGAIENGQASLVKTFTVQNNSEVAVNVWRLRMRATDNTVKKAIPGLTVTFAIGDAKYNTYLVGTSYNGSGNLTYTTETGINYGSNVTGNTDFSGVMLAPGESVTFTVTFQVNNSDDTVSKLSGVEFNVRVDHEQIN